MNSIATQLTAAIDQFIAITNRKIIDWEHKPSHEKWSNKEIIGHLCDSAQINLQRFVRCTYEENFKLIYEQDEWVAAAHYQDADIKEILDLWILLNRQIIRVLSDYPANRLTAVCDNDKNSTQLHTVEWLAADYVRHMQHHLDQVVPK